MKFCSNCGQPVKEGQKFCAKCGKKLVQIKADNEEIKEYTKEIKEEKIKEDKSIENTVKIDSENINAKANLLKDEEKSEDQEQKRDEEKSKHESIVNENKHESDIENKKIVEEGSKKEVHIKGKKKFKKLKIVLGVLLVVLFIAALFRNTISNEYYLAKAESANTPKEKIKMNVKALKSKYSLDTLKNIEDTISKSIKENRNIKDIEEALDYAKSTLPKDVYNKLMVSVYKSKYNDCLNKKNYNEALNMLIKAKKYGYTLKNYNDYEKLMINVISKISNIDNTLSMKQLNKKGMDFGDLDKDGIDEIVIASNEEKQKYENLIVNVYKFNGAEYKICDTKSAEGIEQCWNLKIGKANKDTNAIFLCGVSGVHGGNDTAYTLEKNKLKNTQKKFHSVYPVIPKDVDSDGFIEIPIMEIDPDSVNQSNAGSDKIIEWYKMGNDGEWIFTKQEREKNTDSSYNENNYYDDELNDQSYGDYIIPDSNKRILTKSELSGFSKEKLALARNEIYARHGYVFCEEPFKSYFPNKEWYVPNPDFKFDNGELSNIEIENVKLIKEIEDAM